MMATEQNSDLQAITALLWQYFDGLHRADTTLLNRIFDDELNINFQIVSIFWNL